MSSGAQNLLAASTGGTEAAEEEHPEDKALWDAEVYVRLRTLMLTAREYCQLEEDGSCRDKCRDLLHEVGEIGCDWAPWEEWYGYLMKNRYMSDYTPGVAVDLKHMLFPVMKALMSHDRAVNFFEGKGCHCLSKFHFMPAGCKCNKDFVPSKVYVPNLLHCGNPECHQCYRCGRLLG